MYVLVLFLLLGGISLWEILRKKRLSHKTELILLLVVLAFFACRFSLGMDTVQYRLMYEYILDPGQYGAAFGTRFPLFAGLLYFFHRMNLSFEQVRIVLNFIYLIPIGYIIYKESKNYTLSLLVLIGSGVIEIYYTSALRQMLCMAYFFLAFFRYLKNGKYLQYYLICLPLCLVQEVTLVVLFLPIFYCLFDYLRKHNWINVMLFILAIMGLVIVNYGESILSLFLSPYVLQYFSFSGISFMGLVLRFVLFCLIMGLYHFAAKDKLDRFTQFQVYACFLSLLLYLAFATVPIMSRASDFIDIIHIILIPTLFEAIPVAKQKLVSLAVTTVLFGYLLYSDITQELAVKYYNPSFMNYPYISIFNVEDANRVYQLY